MGKTTPHLHCEGKESEAVTGFISSLYYSDYLRCRTSLSCGRNWAGVSKDTTIMLSSEFQYHEQTEHILVHIYKEAVKAWIGVTSSLGMWTSLWHDKSAQRQSVGWVNQYTWTKHKKMWQGMSLNSKGDGWDADMPLFHLYILWFSAVLVVICFNI